MVKRNQFTFYRSYYDSLKELPAEQVKEILMAMSAYSLDGEEIELQGVSKSIFTLIKPVLDSGNRKAYARQKKSGHTEQLEYSDEYLYQMPEETGKKTEQTVKIDEQTGKKTEQTGKEKEREREKEKEIERDIEIERENNTPYSPPKGGVKAQFSPGFVQFWAVYPKRVGKQAAWKSWSQRKCEPLTEVIVSAVNRQKTWDSWTKDAGQYIPNPATWLNQGRWEDEPPELLHQAVSRKRTASDQWADLTDGNF